MLGTRRCIIPNVLQSFQDLADVVTAIKTHGSVKVITNPAGGNVVARGKTEGPKCIGMVRTFITQIYTVTVHVLHGEPKPVLGAWHRPLTCKSSCTCERAWIVSKQTPAAC